ncbi:hypothetical protein [Mucilaginibacter sp. HD30]
MKSIILNTFKIPGENSIANLKLALEKAPYSDDSGFGFESIEVYDDLISAVLIKRNTTYIYEFDFVSKAMIKKQIMLFSEISFEVDFDYQILSVFGPANHLTQLRSSLRNSLGFLYELGYANLSPFYIYTKLIEKKIPVNFQYISIENFVYENGISGKLIGHVIDDLVAEKLVSNYKTDVCKAILNIHIDENHHFELQVANNGAVKFHSTEDNFGAHFNFFKQTLFK